MPKMQIQKHQKKRQKKQQAKIQMPQLPQTIDQ